MKNNETGEFELVLGNRHLLSGFFVVALLFGVAFAMGYIVGRNSAPSGRTPDTASASSTPAARDARPQAASPAEPPPASPPQEPASRDDTAAPDKPADVPAQPTTQPAREGPAAAPPPAPAPAPTVEPAAGTYWQVIAVPQAQAEIVAKALKDKGFPTSLGQGPNNLVRVLVGPYADTQSLGEAKSKLENAGFHPILKH
jgi:cell division septation protein DedD